MNQKLPPVNHDDFNAPTDGWSDDDWSTNESIQQKPNLVNA